MGVLGGAVRRMPTTWRVTHESLLCLAREGGCTNTRAARNKCLGLPHRLLGSLLNRTVVLLSLLRRLKHHLKDLLLMSSVKRLYDTVLGKIPAEPHDETLIQAFHELGAHADRKVLLVCEGSGHAHQLLEI